MQAHFDSVRVSTFELSQQIYTFQLLSHKTVNDGRPKVNTIKGLLSLSVCVFFINSRLTQQCNACFMRSKEKKR